MFSVVCPCRMSVKSVVAMILRSSVLFFVPLQLLYNIALFH